MKRIGLTLVLVAVVCLSNNLMAQQNGSGFNLQNSRELLEIATVKDVSGWVQFKPETNIDPTEVFEKYPSAFGLSGEDKMVVFPNPVCSSISVSLNESFNYSISDTRGVLLQKGTNEGNKPIDVSGLDKGIYFFEMRSKSGIFVEKIIKM